jgi:hypothetical protein
MNPKVVNFQSPTTDQVSVAVDMARMFGAEAPAHMNRSAMPEFIALLSLTGKGSPRQSDGTLARGLDGGIVGGD